MGRMRRLSTTCGVEQSEGEVDGAVVSLVESLMSLEIAIRGALVVPSQFVAFIRRRDPGDRIPNGGRYLLPRIF